MDYTTQRLFFSTCLTASCIGVVMICWFWFGIRIALKDNEQLTERLFVVAQNLQLAERMTGHPFYTSILDNALPCEKKERLYLGMRNDFYTRCNGMLGREERMPVNTNCDVNDTDDNNE